MTKVVDIRTRRKHFEFSGRTKGGRAWTAKAGIVNGQVLATFRGEVLHVAVKITPGEAETWGNALLTLAASARAEGREP